MDKQKETLIKHRKSSYEGVGRPKKFDYIFLKEEDVLDYIMFEMYTNGKELYYVNRKP